MSVTDTTDVPQIGLGTTLQITGGSYSPSGSSSSSGVANVIVKVTAIKLPTITAKDVETTGMNDPMDTYMPGVINPGEAELDITYLKSQSAYLQSLVNIPSLFVTTYNDGRVKTFTGWINSFGEEVTVKEKTTNKIKIRANTLVTNA